MIIYLRLFLTFLKIGAFTFGGGYAMIPLIREDCIANGWLTEDEILNFIAIAESTPGPIAINMATFVGASQGGILGSMLATLGVVLPSFCIIVIIVALLSKLLKYAGVKAVLQGLRPAVVGMLLATALTMFLSVIFQIKTVDSAFLFEWKSLCIFGVIAAIGFGYKAWKKKAFSPILLIVISGVLGVLFFGL